MSKQELLIRNDINRFWDPEYSNQLMSYINSNINAITDENKNRIESLFAYVTNINNPDMRFDAKVFALEHLYNETEKYKQL